VRKPSDPTLSFRLCQKKEGENAQLAGLNCHLRGKSDCFQFSRRIYIEDNRLAVGLKEEKWAIPLLDLPLLQNKLLQKE
jgi:hypothetical protein